jgi:hypothetical protein
MKELLWLSSIILYASSASASHPCLHKNRFRAPDIPFLGRGDCVTAEVDLITREH